jgi:hypothetical protein
LEAVTFVKSDASLSIRAVASLYFDYDGLDFAFDE